MKTKKIQEKNPPFEPKEYQYKLENNWVRILSVHCDVHINHFKDAVELIIMEPNLMSPAILRAEITNDSNNLISNHNENTDRRIIRQLIPRQPEKDVVVTQELIVSSSDNQMSVQHRAINHNNETVSPSELPYFYPKFKSFRYSFIDQMLSIELLPYEDSQELIDDPRMISIWKRILKFIYKFSFGMKNGYEKRVHHDIAVPKIEYQDLYAELKTKYRHWVDLWPEETDPAKHVFEDIGIATWLICLWKQEKTTKKYKFIDLGCGNGFLTYLLTQEGYSGYGVDLSERKIWSQFPSSTKLYQRPIYPMEEKLEDVDWIIGNHPDELTLWIPIMASISKTKFMIIPCCLHELSGQKFTKLDVNLGRYMTYCKAIEKLSTNLGFQIEWEHLRIPSTKNICLFSRNQTIVDGIDSIIDDLTKTVNFNLRKTDRQKTLEYLSKREMKLNKQNV
ncbi:hypothetical protein BC833DRAFT_588590 [Globomyces pollinis-pini]|nr:hypothetical protein BC833DRAFT_588590 [Globomyces pollinis-pini]